MKKGVIFLALLLPLIGNAQRKQARFELILMGGIASYSGDIGGNKTKFLGDHPEKMGMAIGIGGRMHITNFMALRANFNYAEISGADSFSAGKDIRERNLSFRSPVFEGSLLLELSLFNWKHLTGETVNTTKSGRSNLYLFAGMGFFKFNPQAYYEGRWYDLQPFGTEGQGIKPNTPKYQLTSTALIAGVGYRMLLGGRWSLGFEGGVRKTNTDYLDDVSRTYFDNSQLSATYGEVAAALADRSINGEGVPYIRPADTQRGSSKVKDYYGFAQITLAIKLGRDGNSQSFGGNKRFNTRSRCFQF